MIHEDQAELKEFEWLAEDYNFKVNFHMITEACLPNREVKLIVKPYSSVNGRKINLNLLKNTNVLVRYHYRPGEYGQSEWDPLEKSYEQGSINFADLEFSDEKETFVSFIAPRGLAEIRTLRMGASI